MFVLQDEELEDPAAGGVGGQVRQDDGRNQGDIQVRLAHTLAQFDGFLSQEGQDQGVLLHQCGDDQAS